MALGNKQIIEGRAFFIIINVSHIRPNFACQYTPAASSLRFTQNIRKKLPGYAYVLLKT
jgi:hypothetical protein